MRYDIAIKKARAAVGISQGELARRAGVTPEYICQLEGGEKKNPGAEVIEKLAEALHVPPSLLSLLGAEPDELALLKKTPEALRQTEELAEALLGACVEAERERQRVVAGSGTAALAARCPVCDAPPGAGCITAPFSLGTRRPLRKPHRARVGAATVKSGQSAAEPATTRQRDAAKSARREAKPAKVPPSTSSSAKRTARRSSG